MKEMLGKLMRGEDLSQSEATQLMDHIMSGRLSDAKVAGFLVALKMKGEAPAELAGMALVMRDKAEHIIAPPNTVDTCGTGGDGSNTFNVSTATALLVAGAEIPVAKHGNRAVTSSTGSADVLEQLGIAVEIAPAFVQKCLEETGFCYMHAPMMHLSMKFVMPVRKALEIPTTFNQLGPLTNPARVSRQLLGVSRTDQLRDMAEVIALLRHKHTWVVRGEDGLDEISLKAPTKVVEVIDGEVGETFMIDPTRLNLKHAGKDIPTVENAEQSAMIIRAVFDNTDHGPARDVVILNAAATAVVAGKVEKLEEGIELMQDTLSDGVAEALVKRVAAVTNGGTVH